ncbi:MAG: Membrane protein insertase YidC 2, partial [candidate division WS6 bacterium GW2011_GWE1_34_7]
MNIFTTIWNTIFFYPLLNVMTLFYHFLGDNLGWAILGVAVVARIFMIPLVKRQTEMTKKMANLKPELEKLNKKYANNKEKLTQEQMKLYKKVGYN